MALQALDRRGGALRGMLAIRQAGRQIDGTAAFRD
jgi:hypothetical protein